MRYKNPFQLTSTCEDSFNWCQNCEDHISIGIVNNLSIWYIKKYVFNWYLKMATRAGNGLSIEIKHKFVISPMIERDGHK
jgi:hypothetical protein